MLEVNEPELPAKPTPTTPAAIPLIAGYIKNRGGSNMDRSANYADLATAKINVNCNMPPLDALVQEIDLHRYLNAAKCRQNFVQRIKNLLESIGITDFAHTTFRNVRDGLDPCGTYDPAIGEKWAKEGFHADDLATRHLLLKRTPIFRSVIGQWIDSAPFSNEIFQQHGEATKFMHQHGIFDVYNIPIIRGSYKGLFSISSHKCEAKKFQQIVTRHLANIHLLAELVDSVGWQKFDDQFHDPIGNYHIPIHARPLELLETLANKDITLNEAAEVLNISISTANQHIAAAKKAFKAHTTHGMILAAQREGLILVR